MVVRPGPLYSVADVHHGLVKGLRANGVDVYDFKFDDCCELFNRVQIADEDGAFHQAFDEKSAHHMAAEHLQAACYRFWPDVLVITSGLWVPPLFYDIVAARNHKTVLWFTESPYEDDVQLSLAQRVDVVAVNDPTNLAFFQQVNPESYYFPHSYDPDVHHPGTGAKTCDVAFVGTGFASRMEFLHQIDWTGIDLKLGGMWRGLDDDSPFIPCLVSGAREACMDNVTTASLYRQARASFNLYRKETTPGGMADGWAMGPREVELAAVGTWFARESRPEGDLLFPMLPTFSEPGELEERLRWALTHEPERERAATAAREAVADRTFTATAARLLRVVESKSSPLVAVS